MEYSDCYNNINDKSKNKYTDYLSDTEINKEEICDYYFDKSIEPPTNQMEKFSYFEINKEIEYLPPDFEDWQLLLRDKKYEKHYKLILELLQQAIIDATVDFEKSLENDTSLAETIHSQEKNKEHMKSFTDKICSIIKNNLDCENKVLIIGMATGALPILDEIIDELKEEKLQANYTLALVDHVYQDKLNEFISKFINENEQQPQNDENKQKLQIIVIDDGIATAVSIFEQVVIPYLIKDNEELSYINDIINNIKEKLLKNSSCNNKELLEYYKKMLEILKSKNIILAPYCSKNTLLVEVIEEMAEDPKSTKWRDNQIAILGNENVVLTVKEGIGKEKVETVGARCRDLGIKIGKEIGSKLNLPEEIVKMILKTIEEGEFRHLSILKGLYELTEEGKKKAIEILAKEIVIKFLHEFNLFYLQDQKVNSQSF